MLEPLVVRGPGVPFSMTNPRISSLWTSRAHTTTRSAKVPLPIQRFFPLSTQWSPSRRAVVARPPAMSEPWSGSVSANAPIAVRSAMRGSQRSRCSGEPQWKMLANARPACTPKKVPKDGSTRDISSDVNPLNSRENGGSRNPSYAPPTRSRSRSGAMRCRGNSASAQYSSAIGRTSCSRNSRSRTISFCSSSGRRVSYA